MKKKRITLFALTFLVIFFALGVGSASAEYVTWNPNDKGSGVVLSNDNLTAKYSTNKGSTNVRASEGKTQGKWYWEISVDSASPDSNALVGAASSLAPISTSISSFGSQGFVVMFKRQSDGDIYGFCLDMDSNTMQISKNNTNPSTIKDIRAAEVRPILGDVGAYKAASATYTVNFGATPFMYPVPTGYQPYDGSQQKFEAPTQLAAAPGDAQVTLSWKAVTGAAGYKVKRAATAGGTYAEIEANTKETSYKDTRLTNEKTYYYVVSALGSRGESVNSIEVPATPKALSTNGGTLVITSENGSDRVFNLTMVQIEAFISWYKDRSKGENVYVIEKPDSGLFKSIKYYLIFDKILTWEVKQY